MSAPITVHQKLAFADAVLAIVASHEPDVTEEFREVVQRVRLRPRKGDVDSLFHDFLEWCRGLSTKDREVLSSELKRTVGLPLEFFDHQRLDRIEKIVERGFIRTDDEWRLVEERVQELCEQGGQNAEIATLNTLLASK